MLNAFMIKAGHIRFRQGPAGVDAFFCRPRPPHSVTFASQHAGRLETR
ncbi:hypothetical protein KCP73_18680 [Salmonella enterica subsp. enterica]|nr:hypothetical protein KCP73_18680 [Salmonella enterica subsp. enterica]